MNVIKPEELTSTGLHHPSLLKPGLHFATSEVKRFFVQVPDNATYAVARVSSKTEHSGHFVLHTVELLPKLVHGTLEVKKNFDLVECSEFVHSFKVKGENATIPIFQSYNFISKCRDQE